MKVSQYVSLAWAVSALGFCSPAFAASSCVTAQCHSSIGSGAMVHAPVKDNDCTSCHTQRLKEHPVKEGKSFDLAAKGADLCSQCHDKKFTKKVVHGPVKKGACSSCHQPHVSTGKFMLNMDDNQTDFCLRCHKPAPFQQRYMHGPAAVGTCYECHAAHESDNKALLKGQVRDLCLKCHADFDKTLQEAPMVHPPVKVGPCTSCHNAHGSDVKYFLNKKVPDLCIDCHGNIGKRLAVVKVPHKPLTQPGGCTNCHAAHISKAKGMLSSDEMSVCLGCHGTDTLGNPPLRNIKKDLEGKEFLHGPIKKGTCKACHDPHGSEYFRLLPGNYPSTLYAPYKDGIYDACLKCHEKNLLRFPETSLYTKFRNGKRNLHFVHVANKQKGRTCRICHEPHAGDLPKLIRKEGYQFGEWKIPLNFKMTPTGGRCAPGCHRAFVYDREKAVVYGGYSTGKYYVVK